MMWRIAMWWRGWRYHRGWRPAIIDESPEQDFYGSMTLVGEMEARGWLSAPEVAHEYSGWWGQTTTALAPEALAIPEAQDQAWREMVELGDELQGDWEVMPDDAVERYADRGSAGHVSSGPGGCSAFLPGPGPQALDGEARPDFKVRSLPIELGPNAARVLARWEERRRERWRLDWDNEAAAA